LLTNAGKGNPPRSHEFVVHFPHYDKDALGPASAIYWGDFKLIHVWETGALKLFDLLKDPGEHHDLARDLPDKARELNQRLMNYLAAVNAQMPKPNPQYDPSQPADTPRQREGKGGRRNS
jgi:arylsulfatase A-like enzyme